ncbi:hypothetical protein [Mesorhizobium opportunistum]|uniref:Uncharacterized protein n=1 Tax=Mesorhizobium opportunistum (strain LMG 24607 / HAMBI 3007 / WSM2075) TaxID=536019 RepID=F7XZY1_MESOW|nr:hypothetical protein [Mesorhizobium opportunistum]AEH88195.1 hypothetical protein Mesop_3754 [Mesorhizobium opportunistum WSM2075]
MDTREAILARLVVIAGDVTGIKKVFRNELATNETDLPAIIVLDANEKADPTDPEGRGPKAPRRMIMMPQLLIMLPEASSAVGTALNGFRALLIDAVANDDTLVGLTTNRQGARLAASETQLAWGRSMLGEMGIPFAIPYILFPGSIAG